jgi:small redox-active disulfide protein 2
MNKRGDRKMKIEVCGPGCPRCHSLKETILETVEKLGLEDRVDVKDVTDITDIISRGILITPGLLIDGVKVSEGKVPNKEEIEKWIQERI